MKLTPTETDLIIHDRTQGRPAAERTGYVVVVQFSGPRGRRYRPMRTAVHLDMDAAIAEAERIKGGRYAHGAYPTSDELREVTCTGKVVA